MKLPSRTITPERSRGGFSLLELIVVMAITSIVFGAAAFMISIPNIEKEIREAHSGIENLALRARAMSHSYQQPFIIELREGEVRLMPMASPEDEIVPELSEQVGEPSALRPLDSMSWPVVYKIDPKYRMAVRRWNSNDFKIVSGNVVETWIHQPNSPSEPIAIELVSEEGDAYLSREFHPLTAKATDFELAIGNQ
jgi:prepilin-type N-terminal cleavage/methylation domain-containing protein